MKQKLFFFLIFFYIYFILENEIQSPYPPFSWFSPPFSTDSVDGGGALELLRGSDALVSQGFDFSLPANLFKAVFQLPFVFASLSISCFMLKHSFSSSDTRSLMSSTVTRWFNELPACIGASLLARARFPLWFCEFSRLSETKNQPATEVRSRSCSKNKTWTMTRRGNLSFWAAWVLASKESFWQFMSLQICSFSESVSQGWAWSWDTHQFS